MTVRVEVGDMREVLPRLVAEGVTVDAVVTDPPYHLTTVNRFGKVDPDADTKTSRRAKGRSDPAGRLSRGFLGKTWDGGDVAFQPETWRHCLEVLRPGGFLLAFGGTRTFHRVVCAIEDAGFVVQDTVLDMLSTDSRVAAFTDSLTAEQRQAFLSCVVQAEPTGLLAWVFGSGFPKRRDMLKPAFEPMCLAYRPGGPRTLQVEECHTPTHGETFRPVLNNPRNRAPGTVGAAMHDYKDLARHHQVTRESARRTQELGRYPANIVHDGSDEVLAAFAAHGESRGGGALTGDEPSKPFKGFERRPYAGITDSGTAARFYYSSKADAGDRWHSKHPTVKPVDLMRWLVRLVCPSGGTVLDPFAGSGTTGAAALIEGRHAILVEREAEYLDDIRRRLQYEPTAEPTAEPDLGLLGLPLR